MEIVKTNIDRLFLIKHIGYEDDRGLFLKIFNKTMFQQMGLKTDFIENYYSISHKNVIRGMHFQAKPFAHTKIVHVLQGSVLDVVLDLRKNSLTYGQFFSIELKAKDFKSIYIPEGLAHGFKSLENNTIVIYNQTSEYNKGADSGILWDSFGFDWQNKEEILISERDQQFVKFENFNSPFL